MTDHDDVFRNPGPVSDFVFDDVVAERFDDMLDRSIPFYQELQRMTVELGVQFLDQGGTVYDIGCSTGNTLIGFSKATPSNASMRLVGIEPAEAMRAKAAAKLRDLGLAERITLLADPVERFEQFPDARVITMLFTLQFVRPLHRTRVLRICHDSLAEGGCLIVAEKILADNSAVSRMSIDLYHDYKRRSGYSNGEIVRKREALENVLVPYRDSENRAMLHEAGFRVVEPVFRWYNFAMYLAMKS